MLNLALSVTFNFIEKHILTQMSDKCKKSIECWTENAQFAPAHLNWDIFIKINRYTQNQNISSRSQQIFEINLIKKISMVNIINIIK